MDGDVMIATKREFEALLNAHADRLRVFGVERIGVFGSFARDDQTAESDIDVMAVFHSGQETFRNFMDLADFLEEHTGRRIDLLTPHSLSPRVQSRILSQVEYVVPRAA